MFAWKIQSSLSFSDHYIVWWSEKERLLWILELTISFETGMDQSHVRSESKYSDLIERVKRSGFRGGCIILEVGSRGLLLENELSQLQEALNAPVKTINELARALTCAVIQGSLKIWCSRNYIIK